MTTSNEHNNAPAVPQGEPEAYMVYGNYTRQPFRSIESAQAYMGGLLKSDPEGGYHIRPLFYATPAAPSQEPAVPQGWTDADSDSARLALELECLLMDTKDLSVVSKWWASANEALELHRQRLAATPAPAPAPFAPDWAGYRQGLEDGVQSAADLLKRMAVELVTERGETDPDTGAIQFKSAATREWHASLCELAEEIERLKPAKPAQEAGLTDHISLLEEVASSLEDYKNDAPWGSWDRERLERLYAIIAALRAKGGKL